MVSTWRDVSGKLARMVSGKLIVGAYKKVSGKLTDPPEKEHYGFLFVKTEGLGSPKLLLKRG